MKQQNYLIRFFTDGETMVYNYEAVNPFFHEMYDIFWMDDAKYQVLNIEINYLHDCIMIDYIVEDITNVK